MHLFINKKYNTLFNKLAHLINPVIIILPIPIIIPINLIIFLDLLIRLQ